MSFSVVNTDGVATMSRVERGLRYQVDGSVVWLVTAHNGRVLGRSAAGAADPADAIAALDVLIRSAASLAGVIGHQQVSPGWVWTVADRTGRPVAISGRSYDRRASCSRGLSRFLVALGELRESVRYE